MTPEARMELKRSKILRESRERDRQFDRRRPHFFARHWWVGIALWLGYGLYIVVVRP